MSHPAFRVLSRFQDERGNVYLEGYVYTADRPHLIRSVEQWLEEGKVEWVTPQLKASVGGRGTVQ